MMSNGLGAAVESFLPGRVRVRIPRGQRQDDVFSDITSLLLGIEGIKSVSTNPKTGSVLVEYNPDAIDLEQLVAMGQAAGIIGELSEAMPGQIEAGLPGRSAVAYGISRTIHRIDGEVHWLTKGFLDGKTLVPLLLVGLATARAVMAEKPMPTPWYALMWYGYSLFIQWNRPAKDAESAEVVDV